MATVQERIQKYKTAPFDARFPNTNQTRNCYQNYLDFYRCQKALSSAGKDVALCNWFHRVYKSICPMSWVNRWDEQRESRTFAGKI
ncbi:cytochrome c oxidase subunit 6B1-like [Scyliorhinus canicula]|uniref:cytochrome c oxidase subunit 6B1-like n=1 Tax=Scyliorhinus canicula TaxID=7830 RepID=UPI0018F68453|nr:cytochrome c oxidase subunit 6B1-like [Scyliorhinus canicula]XP_038644314.1 cytochrome c oxidase subunit 6B1-like [Scyliorhinus canicula]XP_038644315.1 cytochrome c oxidase subunit 6B1-like [Scyliorhinus canicula]